ncbi:unnamed protein product [Arctia plantaginis]|uniref:Uncharacterized protein n=1 Tax=Arctia plantaginis TaxID=874455 RepID=A0A8S1A1T8_ARCPL|nr:unnamed protein product [Arctia plantaginis]
MDVRDTLKFLTMTMTMTAGVLYSYGLFKIPWIGSNKNQAADIISKVGDNRTDGGTAKILLFYPNDTCSKAEVVVYDRSKAACIKHPPHRMLWASRVKAPWNALSHTNSCYAFDCHTY